ncbi:bacillithiol system redox-active protein YtxJ [Flavobacterium plurextorum]|uniref:bacillithiol system redox-active protein YtxJ n=1 Tax=Flavobacterium TaxID=237 RepID=UPI00214D5ABC|nr:MULTISPECIES: bacillithiol system redox-active protein YtxJ [Flavobacterium]UUW08753.1 bacillithiol system redox-active protein YtxJ [Flavobacterium plurextorum]
MNPKKWNTISTENEVLEIIEKSAVKPQIIFKDSVSCGISAFAKERLTNDYGLIENIADFNYLDLLSHRAISNFITAKLEVTHQSPQIIVLIDGKVIFRDSHHSIDAKKIADKINNF